MCSAVCGRRRVVTQAFRLRNLRAGAVPSQAGQNTSEKRTGLLAKLWQPRASMLRRFLGRVHVLAGTRQAWHWPARCVVSLGPMATWLFDWTYWGHQSSTRPAPVSAITAECQNDLTGTCSPAFYSRPRHAVNEPSPAGRAPIASGKKGRAATPVVLAGQAV